MPEATRRRLLGACALLALAACLPAHAQAQVQDTIARIKPSVVAIGTYLVTRSPAFLFRGTGFAVGDGTLVATNAHVLPTEVDPGGREVLVALSHSGSPKPNVNALQVLSIDAPHDVALLRVQNGRLPALALSGTDVREGDRYYFTGFPLGNALGFYPVTNSAMIASVVPIALPAARASQLNTESIRRIAAGPFPVYQLDADAYPGNSGSPLYAADSGEVVGILNAVAVKKSREASLTTASGIAYAIPVEHLKALLGNVSR